MGKAVNLPEPAPEDVFFSSTGGFMGGNVRLPLDYVVFIKPKEYLELSEREKYGTARAIGRLNAELKGKNAALIGPGRWGTTTPSLGVPVRFSELCNMSVMCEVSYRRGGLMPELSFGSHFFQDIVESGIFYAAVFDGEEGVEFRPEFVLERKNLFGEFVPGEKEREEVIHISETNGLTLYSDIRSQKVLCCGC
jgi:hypothetical protein